MLELRVNQSIVVDELIHIVEIMMLYQVSIKQCKRVLGTICERFVVENTAQVMDLLINNMRMRSLNLSEVISGRDLVQKCQNK